MLKIFLGYSTLHKILLWCRIQQKKNLLRRGIQKKKICSPSWNCSSLYPTTEKILFCCIPQRRKTFSVVSHSEKKLFRCIPQQKKPLPLYPTTAKNVKLKWLHEKKIFSKMILTHESGSQEDQFDEKKWRQKISWYYPFKFITLNSHLHVFCAGVCIRIYLKFLYFEQCSMAWILCNPLCGRAKSIIKILKISIQTDKETNKLHTNLNI